MANGHRLRVLQLVVDALETVPGILLAKLGPHDLNRLMGKLPAACVIGGFGGEVENLPARQIAVTFPFAVDGFVKTTTDQDPATILTAVEDFYQAVENVVLGTTLAAALIADAKAHGNEGCTGILLDGAPTAEDQWPPFGAFRMHVRGRLHYTRGGL